jgi:hypothetical protein
MSIRDELAIPFTELIQSFPLATLKDVEARMLFDLSRVDYKTTTAQIEKMKSDLAEVRRLIQLRQDITKSK